MPTTVQLGDIIRHKLTGETGIVTKVSETGNVLVCWAIDKEDVLSADTIRYAFTKQ